MEHNKQDEAMESIAAPVQAQASAPLEQQVMKFYLKNNS